MWVADIYELMLTVDLRDDVPDDELDELRWHLGLGSQPEDLRIVKEFPHAVEGEHGELVVENHPVPLLGCHGAATKLTGALVSVLARSGCGRGGGWVLTSRQEFHPDEAEGLGELLSWIAGKASDYQREPDGNIQLGWTRFYEEQQPEPLMVRDGVVGWPL
ncbi:hypothetical protein SAMN05444716_1085 [Streptomyces harbinensis]|uniref:Uncharacterized protein n=1 Tax=Streptomyces harbinensis TaxID=1176198 RepID=A0A1I6VF53_9ACTN|nr:hypothetical protein SAMN05444716_1085 [Streptomyces harbinensis]